ncbi:CRISPR-associated endonuclease Cas1 [Anaerostipes sp. 992a]|uniref:CRISPR-associated endonuclease Cas1 n=1 Tax=Anaerostipes sp. 992a TaxID=1261637 RepID=UPI000951C956|nr:CRISPR-associated endonuclease Cas1 [Anaerostipes sp. 992a]OLR64025.1 CRISPR-associated endonuclease Cas1 [Anaerostipes sp. 992a]
MSYLYVMEHGATIQILGGYFVVKYKNGMEKRIPKETLEAISLFGNISLSINVIEECLRRGIPVNYYSKRGAYYGRLESTRHVNIFRQKKQLVLSDDDKFSLELSKRMIQAKIHNQKVILRRYTKNTSSNTSDCIKSLNIAESKVKDAKSTDKLMGYEGYASKSYFKGLEQIVGEEFHFHGRNRMPPKDPVNSMLSLGYTILMYEIYGQIESRGLHPYAGFLHKDRERHPTLASDLMEEWRAVIIDATVLNLIRSEEIKADMFETLEETGGVILNKQAMKVFIMSLEKKLMTEMNYLKYIDYRCSFRRAFWLQIGQLIKAIEAENPEIYEPIRIR